ncbi:cache domain-containing protein [uncultured Desulfobacter sp.]|uniref:cache domain-containing protein n=1 Tax=uncultured Desulfobacter sp. TaxID=240139 RepID=UPI002AAAB394|nr:cache domain-containing protein [uncultured Desulfobacter sp.]
MGKKIDLIRIIRIWGTFFLLGLGVIFILIDVLNSYRDFNQQAKQMRSEFIDRQKNIIRQEVLRVVDMVRYEKSQSETITEKKIKLRVYEAYSIAQNIYHQYNLTESEVRMQQILKDVLRPIRFENGLGYYFATRIDGAEMLFADRPEMEGQNLLSLQDTRGRYVIQDMIQLIKKDGEGFYEYHWSKPGISGNGFKKISFIKRFEPWDWFIGTGLYVDDIEDQIKNNLLENISRIRFGKEGYIFVNRLGGDALVSNGQVFPGTKKLWEIFNDHSSEMKEIFSKEYQAALKPEGDYIEYSFIKLSDANLRSKKISFIFGLPEFNWLVGAGVYLDDVENEIDRMNGSLVKQIKTKIFYFALIVVVVLGLFFLFFNLLNEKLKTDILLFVSFFKKAASSDDEINRNLIKFNELDQIAEYANEMQSDRIKAIENLKESEKKHRLFVTSYQGIAYQVDIDHFNPLLFGGSVKQIVGFSAEDFLQGNINWLDLIHSEDAELFQGEFEKLRFKPGYLADNEYRVKNKNGEDRWVKDTGRVVRINEKDYIQGTIVDITEKKTIEAHLHHAQKMEAIGSLAGGIAHDFNNILSGMMGYAQLAQNNLKNTEKVEEYLKRVVSGAQRASEIVQQILTFSRQAEYKKQPINMGHEVTESLKLLKASIPAIVDLIAKIESNAWISGDSTKIHQVVMNLCTNGYHAMKETGGSLHISLDDIIVSEQTRFKNKPMPPGNFVRLTVTDTGHGMDHRTLAQVMEPYFTTKETGQGTGLGLSLVKAIVDEHDGFIDIHSKINKGTTVHVFFPAISHQNNFRQHTKKIIDKSLSKGNERIMVVDDEEAIRSLLKILLEKYGYQVTLFQNGSDALEAFRLDPGRYDLIVTDMTMPKLSGIELSKAVLKIKSGLPIIMCTGYNDNFTENNGLQIGIRTILQKPFDNAKLVYEIQEIFRPA